MENTNTITVHICHCNKCDKDYEDMNPQSESVLHTVPHTIDTLTWQLDDDGGFWGCPTCKTDAYLIDK